jgi:putative inorganic carbon (hco3(-)) transporter
MHATGFAPLSVLVLAFAGLALFALIVVGAALPVLAVALLAPLLFAISERPQRGVLLLIALVPFDGLLLILDLPSQVDAWKEVLVALTLLATFVCPPESRAWPARSRPAWLLPLVGWIIIGVASVAASPTLESLVGLKIDFFYVLLALAVWRCPLAEREQDRLISIFMATGLICALVGLWQQALGHVALNQQGYEYNATIRFAGNFLRSFSTFDSPFAFGFHLMLVLVVCTPVALANTARLRNKLYLFALPIYVAGMLSSVVRAAVLGAGIGLVYLGFRRYRVLLAALPLGLVAFVFLGVLGGSVSSTFASGSSFSERQVGWSENFSQVVRHPLGAGIGATGAAAEKAAELQFVVPTDLYNPDNYYFKTVYELGVLGLWMFVLFLIGAFVSTRHAVAGARPRDGPLLDGVGALILAAVAASFVANFFDAFPVDANFWVLLALVATRGADRRARERTPDEGEVVVA